MKLPDRADIPDFLVAQRPFLGGAVLRLADRAEAGSLRDCRFPQGGQGIGPRDLADLPDADGRQQRSVRQGRQDGLRSR